MQPGLVDVLQRIHARPAHQRAPECGQKYEIPKEGRLLKAWFKAAARAQ